MSILKRTISITKDELAKAIGLPKGAEILAVRDTNGFKGEIEFLIVNETTSPKVTYEVETKDLLKMVVKQDEEDVQSIFEDIVRNLDRRN